VEEVMDQGGGHDAGTSAAVEVGGARQVERRQHRFEEMLAVVIATRNSGADARVDILGDRRAGAVQWLINGDIEGLHR